MLAKFQYWKMKKMAKKKSLLVFMDVSVDGDPAERMVFEVLLCLNLLAKCRLHINLCSAVLVVCFCSYSVVWLMEEWIIYLLVIFGLIQLFPDVAPKTAENFRALCTGNITFVFSY